MNVHETTDIRELTIAELDEVIGGFGLLALGAAAGAAMLVGGNIADAKNGAFTHFRYCA